MKQMRSSMVVAIAYLLLVGGWIFVSRLGPTHNPQLIFLKTYKDYALIILFWVLLAFPLIINTRGLQAEEERRKKAEEELRRKQAHLDGLIQTTGRANSTLDLPGLLEAICQEVATNLGAEAATLTLYHPQRAMIEISASYGLPEDFEQRYKEIPFSASYLQIASQDKPIVLTDEDRDLSALPHGEIYRKNNFKTLVYLPLRQDQDYLGGLTVLACERQAQVAPAVLTLIKAFADQAALAIKNERLLAAARESERKLEILRAGDLAILSSLDLNLTLKVFLQQVVDQLKVDAADVLLFNTGTQMLEYTAGIGFLTSGIKDLRIPLGTGYAGKIALERRSMYISDINMTGPFDRRGLLGGEKFISYFGSPLIAKGQVKGVLEVFQRSSFYPADNWLSFLETLGGQAAIAIDNASLFANLQQMNMDLSIAYDRTLEGWSHALDLRDKETEGHTQRVTELCMRLAKEFNIRENDMLNIRRGALLHDIGKMGVPDQVLNKPGELTDEEQRIIKMHPTFAFEMLSPISFLQPAIDIPYCHHERWDGSGYPRGLKGEVIPLTARIFAVADVWDALTSDRPYRKAISREEALQYFREQAGKQFDPQVVDSFLVLMSKKNE